MMIVSEKIGKKPKSRNQLMKWNESNKKNYNEVVLITEQKHTGIQAHFFCLSLSRSPNLLRITHYALIALNIYLFLVLCAYAIEKKESFSMRTKNRPSSAKQCLHWLNYSLGATIGRYEFLCYYLVCVCAHVMMEKVGSGRCVRPLVCLFCAF